MIPGARIPIVGLKKSSYKIARSLRFRSGNSAYASQAAGTSTDRSKKTISMWIKRGSLSSQQHLISTYGSGGQDGLWIDSSDKLHIYAGNGAYGGTINGNLRDIAEWYHIVYAMDTSQTSSFLRMRIWINGVEYPGSSWDATVAIPQNSTADKLFNQSYYVGRDAYTGGYYYDGYMTEVVFCDGYAYDASYFGKIDSATNRWVPKPITGINYGAQGGYYKCIDNSSTANLGTDSSGNGKTWTMTGFSVTNDTTNDSMVDTPTPYGADSGVGGEVRGNYATLLGGGTMVAADGNLKVSSAYGADIGAMNTTMAVSSGKWYWEFVCVNIATYPYVGIAKQVPYSSTNYWMNQGWGVRASGASTGVASAGCPSGASETLTGISFATNDILMFAMDCDNKKLWVGKNGTWFNSGSPTGGTNQQLSWTETAELSPQVNTTTSGGGGIGSYFNFGQRPFSYTAPSGFKTLCTKNLSEPTIKKPKKHFDAFTYTGNGGNQFVGDPFVQPIDSYQFANGLRFQSANSCYMSRSVASAGNQQKWTFSAWVKRTKLGGAFSLFEDQRSSGTSSFYVANNSDKLYFQVSDGTTAWAKATTAVFRDVQNWHHYMIAVDTTNATGANRQRLYVDGVEITTWDTNQTIPQNTNTTINASGGGYYLGRWASGDYFDGYVAQAAFVDGQQLTPSTFGTYDANGNWIPKDLSTGITWGTNGFWLPFTNTSTTATLGNDSSGNNNTFTTSGFSVTSGTTYDPLTDCPASYGSDTGAGGQVKGNYATLNPINGSGLDSARCTAGNLTFNQGDGATYRTLTSTMGMTTGKWYWEVNVVTKASNGAYSGLARDGVTLTNFLGQNSTGWVWEPTGAFYNNNTNIFSASSFTTGDVLGYAFDADTGKFYMHKNGTWQNSGNPAAGTGQIFTAATGFTYFAAGCLVYADVLTFNFGQRAFSYTAPSGFKALCTTNMVSDSEIVSTPDIAWFKVRNTTGSWVQSDSVQGIGKYVSSDSQGAATTDTNSVQNFNFNGVYIGNATILNTLNNTYASYFWNKSALCGVDVIQYSGSNSAQNVPHSLGVAPSMYILKNITSGASNWTTYHSSVGSGNGLNFNSTAGSTTYAIIGAPTSSNIVFSSGNDINVTRSGDSFILYAFAEIAGFSKFGKYTGNGSTDGPFVYCGFRPRFVLTKRTDSTGSWIIADAARATYNESAASLVAETNGAETTGAGSWHIDLLSNGFKLRDTGPQINASGGTYIFAAFAEAPFKYARAR